MSGTAFVWGKLPAHGDFVARGLTAAMRDRIDDWLAASIADAREVMGEGFDPAYDSAPPWRFAWEEPEGWTAGAMAPSIDGVGRRYPIMVARTAMPATAVEPAAATLEDLLYRALGNRRDADMLVAAAAAVDPDDAAPWTYGARWWTLGGHGFAKQVVVGEHPPTLMRNMLMQEDG